MVIPHKTLLVIVALLSATVARPAEARTIAICEEPSVTIHDFGTKDDEIETVTSSESNRPVLVVDEPEVGYITFVWRPSSSHQITPV